MHRPVLLNTWLESYRQHVTSGIHRPKTASDILRRLDIFFSRYPDRKLPEDIFLSDIEDFKNIRATEGQAEATVKQEIVVVRNFYAWLKLRGVDVLNPARTYAANAPRDARVFPLISVEQLSKILSVAHEPLDKLIVLIGITLGLRLIDLSNIIWNAFEDDFSVLIFDGRRLPIRHDLSVLLTQISSDTNNSGSDFVFPGKTAEYRWKKIRAKAGLESLLYLSLRNTLALYMLRLRVDLVTAKYLLGDLSPMLAQLDLEPPRNDIARKFVESIPLPKTLEDRSSPDKYLRSSSIQVPPMPQTPNYAVHPHDQTSDPQATLSNACQVCQQFHSMEAPPPSPEARVSLPQ